LKLVGTSSPSNEPKSFATSGHLSVSITTALSSHGKRRKKWTRYRERSVVLRTKTASANVLSNGGSGIRRSVQSRLGEAMNVNANAGSLASRKISQEKGKPCWTLKI
jgi:hypothetical protein